MNLSHAWFLNYYGVSSNSGRALWDLLRSRLLSVVRMQNQWGPLHDLYDAQQESRFETIPLPKRIRDPDSSFSACWDLVQVKKQQKW